MNPPHHTGAGGVLRICSIRGPTSSRTAGGCDRHRPLFSGDEWRVRIRRHAIASITALLRPDRPPASA